MNKYTLKYTIIKPEGVAPEHKQYTFECDYDLLGAADEAMSKLFDQYEKGKDDELLFRAIELTNAKEVYKNIIGRQA